jgi:hypothetical protein
VAPALCFQFWSLSSGSRSTVRVLHPRVVPGFIWGQVFSLWGHMDFARFQDTSLVGALHSVSMWHIGTSSLQVEHHILSGDDVLAQNFLILYVPWIALKRNCPIFIPMIFVTARYLATLNIA